MPKLRERSLRRHKIAILSVHFSSIGFWFSLCTATILRVASVCRRFKWFGTTWDTEKCRKIKFFTNKNLKPKDNRKFHYTNMRLDWILRFLASGDFFIPILRILKLKSWKYAKQIPLLSLKGEQSWGFYSKFKTERLKNV